MKILVTLVFMMSAGMVWAGRFDDAAERAVRNVNISSSTVIVNDWKEFCRRYGHCWGEVRPHYGCLVIGCREIGTYTCAHCGAKKTIRSSRIEEIIEAKP